MRNTRKRRKVLKMGLELKCKALEIREKVQEEEF
jgi:hypothetical protein